MKKKQTIQKKQIIPISPLFSQLFSPVSILAAAFAFLLFIPGVQASYLLRAVAADAVTTLDINPTTFTINGSTIVGTPRAEFPNIPENAALTLSGSASGYVNRTDDQFYDGGLQSCVGKQTCNLATTVQGQSFSTQCGFSATFQDFECNVTNNNIRIAYFFKPAENRVTYIQLLTPTISIPNTPPTISISASPASGPAPLSVAFTVNVSDSSGVQSVTIFFGDGTSQSLSKDSRIVHVYPSQGVFVPLVQAFDPQGLQSTKSITINVSAPSANPPPAISASVSPLSGNAPLTSVFRANITDADGISNATWFFGDGLTQVVANNNPANNSLSSNSQINHTYQNPGLFFPFIESFDALGNRATQSFAVTANNPNAGNTAPVIAATVSPSNGSSPLNVFFTANATDNNQVFRVTWFFGDGQSQVVLNNGNQSFSHTQTAHVYQSPGVYTPIVQAVDETGLVTIQSFTITVNALVNSPPTVNINANPSQGILPLAVNVTVDAIDDRGIASAVWNFGDGQSFAIPVSGNPRTLKHDIIHFYPSAGQFLTQITVTDSDGAQTIKQQSVNVTASQPDNPPVINAQVVPTFGLPPLAVTFQINVSDNRQVRSLVVFFGDGTSQTVVSNGNQAVVNVVVLHTYQNPGAFVALIQAMDDLGQSTVNAFNVLVTSPSQNTPPIIATASATPTAGNVPLAVSFLVNATDDAIIQTASLNFGDGQSQLLVQNGFLPSLNFLGSHTYQTVGTFTAILHITDNQGAATTRTFTIFAGTAPLGPPAISASVNPLTGTAPLTSIFGANVTSNIGVSSVIWFFGDGTSQVVSANSQISHTYANPGQFFPLIAANDTQGQQAFRQFTVTVNPSQGNQNQPPVITATVNPTIGNAPLTSVFTANVTDDVQLASVVWNFGDGQNQTIQNQTINANGQAVNSQISHTYTTVGAFAATITAIDNQNASTNRSFQILVNNATQNQPPVIRIQAAPSSGPIPLASLFTANVTDDVLVRTVTWFFGDGQSAVVAQNGNAASSNTQIAHTYLVNGTFVALLVAQDDQGATSTATVVINALPGNATVNLTIPQVQLAASPAVGIAPLNVTFTARATDDNIVRSVLLSFGDGQSIQLLSNGNAGSFNATASHIYQLPGTYSAVLVALDDQNQAASAVQIITAQINTTTQQGPVLVPEVIDVFIPQIRFDHPEDLLPGGQLTTYIAFENRGNTGLEDVQASITIPDFGIKKNMKVMDLSAGEKKTQALVLDLPQGAAPGVYKVRITVSNNNMRRVVFRELTIVGSPAAPVPETVVVTCPGPSIWCRFG